MLRSFKRAVMQVAAAALVFTSVARAGDTLCSIPPVTYTEAKSTYPASAFALEALESFGIATWYSDRTENGDYAQTAADLVATCGEDTRLSVVIYGIPNKDCAAGESAVGSTVTNTAEYEAFLQTLIDAVGSRKVLYILEPDAIGLLADSTSCGQQAGYLANLQTAIGLLSQNENAQIYLDVGYWTLEYSSTASTVAEIVKQLVSSGSKVKGISLNTSNYQSTTLLSTLCGNFQSAVGSMDLHCIFDTSRNYNGAPSSDEWCNVKSAGIGAAPTSDTGMSNVDYLLWVKPPGDSDGTCAGRTSDAMTGPSAGVFSNDIFQTHWNQGILVKEMGYNVIDGTIYPTSSSSASASSATASSSYTPAASSTSSSSTGQKQDSTTTAPSDTVSQNETSINQSVDASSYAQDTSVDGDADTSNFSLGTVSTGEDQTSTDVPLATTSTPSTASDSTADQTSSSEAQEANTQSGASGGVDTGVIVAVALVAAAVVAVAAIVGVRVRQRKLVADAKTPTDPYPLAEFSSRQLATARDSNILSAL